MSLRASVCNISKRGSTATAMAMAMEMAMTMTMTMTMARRYGCYKEKQNLDIDHSLEMSWHCWSIVHGAMKSNV